MEKIYLDNNATTKIDPLVLKEMQKDNLPYNPSSIHFFGREAKKMLENARDSIASYLNVKSSTLTFTSSGTEAVNMAIKGLLDKNKKAHIIASRSDHACVYNTLLNLESLGHELTFVPTTNECCICLESIKKHLKENKNIEMIVTSYANSETGAITNIEELCKIAKENNIKLVVDAVGILGKETFKISEEISAMCFSSHKIHGPKGVGLLYLNEKIEFNPILFGGAQENSNHPGTENLMGIIGFSKAVSLLKEKLPKASQDMRMLRDYFEENILKRVKSAKINGCRNRVSNTSNICFKDVDGESLLILLDQNNILASLGSACSSKAITPSRPLIEMGLSHKEARSSIRFSLSRETTKDEIDKTIEIIIKIIKNLS